MSIRRIAICGARVTAYDEHMLGGLAGGFRSIGIESIVIPKLLDSQSLAALCAAQRVDTVLEINRSRNSLKDLPSDIVHICWIQDIAVGERAEPSRSDLTYFLTEPSIIGYSTAAVKGYAGLLFTGVALDASAENDALLSDFSFVGYVPPPIPAEILPLPMFRNRPRPTIGEMVVAFISRYRPPNFAVKFGDLHHDRVRSIIREIAAEFFGVPPSVDFHFRNVLDIFDQNVVRAFDRVRLLEAALKVSKSLRIFGPPVVWHLWPQFRPYHVCFLDSAQDVLSAYRTSQINLHINPNGFGMHSRVLDCMSCGSTILTIESPYDSSAGGIRTEFESGTHYISCTFDTFADCARRWLGDEAGRRAIGAAARKIVMAKHTWRHRAEQIVRDVASRIRR